jgi:hypothetical protein
VAPLTCRSGGLQRCSGDSCGVFRLFTDRGGVGRVEDAAVLAGAGRRSHLGALLWWLFDDKFPSSRRTQRL